MPGGGRRHRHQARVSRRSTWQGFASTGATSPSRLATGGTSDGGHEGHDGRASSPSSRRKASSAGIVTVAQAFPEWAQTMKDMFKDDNL